MSIKHTTYGLDQLRAGRRNIGITLTVFEGGSCSEVGSRQIHEFS